MNSEALVVPDEQRVAIPVVAGELSVDEIVAKVEKVRKVAENVMKKDIHYGVIPGTKKPTLLKPGGEVLGLTFRLTPKYEIQRVDLSGEHVEYQVTCNLYHIHTGDFYGSGLGSCSTMESKYRYRTGPKEFTDVKVPQDYWNIRKSDPTKAKELIGGPGRSTGKNDHGEWVICIQGEQIENPNIADCYNTVLKIGAKRAYIDAILKATAASEVYTQDLEDFQDQNGENAITHKPSIQKPQRKSESKAEETAPHPTEEGYPGAEDQPQEAKPEYSGRTITEKQRKRMYAIARSSGLNDEQFRDELLRMGFESSEVPVEVYDDVVSHFESMKQG